MSTSSSSHSFHTTHSNTYDRLASNATFNIIKQVIPALPVPITPQSYILDNACGTGIATMVMKHHYPFARIHGADLAPGMVAMFKERVTAAEWENVDAEALDCRDLHTLKEETFTHVVTNFGFSPTPNDLDGPLKAAKEMYRVLRKGGIAVVTTWAERNFTPALTNSCLHIRPHEKPYSWDVPSSWSSGSWLFKQFEDAGFGHEISVHVVHGRMEAGSLDELVSNMMLFKDMFCKDYSEEELARLLVVLREEVQKLDAFEQTARDVGIEMVAWVAIAKK